MDASESELAAVPLKTKNTSQCVSNSSRNTSDARRVHVVAVADRSVVGLQEAAQASGQMPA